jgi:phosphomannomutase
VNPAVERSVRAWIADDPDPGDRAELEALLTAARSDEEASAELEDRFGASLTFGTAGLRGAVAAGPNRMNRATVRMATVAVGAFLLSQDASAAERGVVIGCDARHRSDLLADETARVLTGVGIRVHLLPHQRPTPLTAFAVRHLGAAAAIMITASHNPRADNGYKLYLGDGAQIIPPVDTEIETLMNAVGSLASVPLGSLDDPVLAIRHGEEIVDAYAAAIGAASPERRAIGDVRLRVVYTPLHGVAASTFLAAIAAAGKDEAPYVVPEQAMPDPDFPTVPYPNPEAAGALDLALAAARSRDADLIIANDPDGDRLAVAVPDPSLAGGWRVLTGDQLGCLLGDFLMTHSDGDRLAATTIVSSRLLSRIAAGHGVGYVETLTGFKWIARAADGVAGSRFLFGYEEALGYAVGDVVRDKDGISAALAFLALATEAAGSGTPVVRLLDDLYVRHGLHLTSQLTVPTDDAALMMDRLRAEPPTEFAGVAVAQRVDLADGDPDRHLPPSDVLVFFLGDSTRIVVRPSGTEPKLKAYIEVIEPLPDAGALEGARAAASSRMEAVREAVVSVIG